MITRLLILVFGVFCGSTAVIMIKASAEHPVLLASYRLLVAALVLTPVFLRDLHKHRALFRARDLRLSIVPGLALGLHFIIWNMGARMTRAVNASLIVNLTPIAMPFLLLAMIRERVNRGEIAGTAIALVGLVLLSGSDYTISREHFLGDMVCLLAMLCFCAYLVMGRKYRHVPSTVLYIVPVYYVAGIACFLCSLLFINPVKPYALREILLILGLGLIPTVLGHSIYNYSVRHLRGQMVSIVNMGQFIFAGLLAFLLLGEAPGLTFYLAAGLLVTGGYLAVRAQP